MPVQRFRDADGDAVLTGQIVDELGQIALEVNAERQKIGQHKNLFRPGRSELSYGFIQTGLGFEECGLKQVPCALNCRSRRYDAHGFVGRGDAGPVPEYYDSQSHCL